MRRWADLFNNTTHVCSKFPGDRQGANRQSTTHKNNANCLLHIIQCICTCSSSCCMASFMPFPPPPKAALTSTGNPILAPSSSSLHYNKPHLRHVGFFLFFPVLHVIGAQALHLKVVTNAATGLLMLGCLSAWIESRPDKSCSPSFFPNGMSTEYAPVALISNIRY